MLKTWNVTKNRLCNNLNCTANLYCKLHHYKRLETLLKTKIDFIWDFESMMQDNYKDTRITSLEVVIVSFLLPTLSMFFFSQELSQKQPSRKIIKNNSIEKFRFSRKNWCSFFIVTQFSILFIITTWNFTRRYFNQDLPLQKVLLRDVYKISVLKDLKILF